MSRLSYGKDEKIEGNIIIDVTIFLDKKERNK